MLANASSKLLLACLLACQAQSFAEEIVMASDAMNCEILDCQL
jgi:hypothetical protein